MKFVCIIQYEAFKSGHTTPSSILMFQIDCPHLTTSSALEEFVPVLNTSVAAVFNQPLILQYITIIESNAQVV